jgi:hypothetical protein
LAKQLRNYEMAFVNSYNMGPALSLLVERGVVNVHVEFTRTGTDIWVRVNQPHPRLGVFPNESMTPEDAIRRLAKTVGGSGVEKTSLPELKSSPWRGSFVKETPDADVPASSPPGVGGENYGAPMGTTSFMTLTAAQVRIQREGLDTVTRKSGVLNKLPDDSLTSYDAERSLTSFTARAIVVANALGNHTIISRIRTSEPLQVKGAPDLELWWNKATPTQRLKVLSNKAKLRDECINLPYVQRKAQDMQCPFRGPRSAMVIPQVKASGSLSPNAWEDSDEETGGARY